MYLGGSRFFKFGIDFKADDALSNFFLSFGSSLYLLFIIIITHLKEVTYTSPAKVNLRDKLPPVSGLIISVNQLYY